MGIGPFVLRLMALAAILSVGWTTVSSFSAQAQEDPRYYPESGFRVDDDRVWGFYSSRGGPRAFGLPISRGFKLQGVYTQIFERHVLQVTETGAIYVVALLDNGWMPFRQIAYQLLPPYDSSLTSTAPSPDSPSYIEDVYAYVENNLPASMDGYPTEFFKQFSESIAPLDPNVTDPTEQMLLALQNLDVWGIPTSRPLRDPLNPGQISVRLERGLFRFSPTCRCTQPLPLGKLFRAMLTGSDMPGDLEAQAPDHPFFRQYDLDSHKGPYRAWQLPDTDLGYAFLPSLQGPPSPLVAAPSGPAVAPTSTPVNRPTPSSLIPGATPLPTNTPAPLYGPMNRQPYEFVLQKHETGRETTLVASESGESSKALWQYVRYERDRNPETSGLGPNIIYNKIYVARNPEVAREIYSSEINTRNFPEAVDRFGAPFYLQKLDFGDEDQVMGSCFEEGCNVPQYQLHLRLVWRYRNIVSVFYTFGDQLSSSLQDVAFLARNVNNRIR